MKGNKKTVALTEEQYKELITTIQAGAGVIRPNYRIATALVLEANLGLRISDIVALHLSDIVRDGNRYRLDITEQKTGKKRVFTVPVAISGSMQSGWELARMICCSRSLLQRYKSTCGTSARIWAMRVSALTASGNSMQRIFTRTTTTTLCSCKPFCSIAAPQ